jgi:hypothetical protein
MIVALIFGCTAENFSQDKVIILVNPLGIVSPVDLYTGLFLLSCWIICRKESILMTITWAALMMVLGFFTGSLYTFLALQKSGGDWKRFRLGRHTAEIYYEA